MFEFFHNKIQKVSYSVLLRKTRVGGGGEQWVGLQIKQDGLQLVIVEAR